MFHKSSGRISLTFSLAAFALATLPFLCAAQTSKDSKKVSALLSEAKEEAVQLRRDADELKSFTKSTLTWESHATKVTEIRDHVNNSGQLLWKLSNTKSEASPWQQQAIDQITPLLKELAANVTATIEHLNQRPQLLQTGPYAEYVAASYEHAASLAELIGDYVDYDESKAKSEELASKLNVPTN